MKEEFKELILPISAVALAATIVFLPEIIKFVKGEKKSNVCGCGG